MATPVSRSVIFFLLFALLCWACCSGKMKLCSNNLTGFKNGTAIPATVGEPVTISFCVQWQDSDGRIRPYIKIIHPNHFGRKGMNMYLLNEDTATLMINVFVDNNSARIHITIRNVEQSDLRDVFAVELATMTSYNFHFTNVVFTFQLKLADPVADVLSAPPTATSVRSHCCPGKTPACPENWYQVDNDTCLTVVDAGLDRQPWAACSKHGAQPLANSDRYRSTCCLEKILDDSQGDYEEIVPLYYSSAHYYVGMKIRAQTEHHKLACFQSIQNFSHVPGVLPPSQSDPSMTAAVWVTIGVIVGVIVTVAVFLVRVIFQKRAERSAAVSEVVKPNTEYDELASTKCESDAQETPSMGKLDSFRYMEIKDAQ